MTLKTEWLSIIQKLAEVGSISVAADALGYTQQALSYTLGIVEQYFKCSLFERQSRALVLTPEGQKVLAFTHSYFEQMEALQASLQDFQADGLARKWRVARSTSFTSAHQVGHLLHAFKGSFPDYTLALEWVTQPQLEQVMLKENIPLGLSFYPAKSPQLTALKLFESPYVWAMHPQWLGLPKVPVIEFKYHYLNRAKQLFHEGPDYTYLSDLTLDQVPSLASGNMLEIVQWVKQGCGKACIPQIDIARELDTGELCLLGVTPEKVTGYLLVAEPLLPPHFVAWLKARKEDEIPLRSE
jgi:DNA-binding transcriptional LysR family regulator